MEPKICTHCSKPVIKNENFYDVFENMHWLCFHLEFEHNTEDVDTACNDPSCIWRRQPVYKYIYYQHEIKSDKWSVHVKINNISFSINKIQGMFHNRFHTFEEDKEYIYSEDRKAIKKLKNLKTKGIEQLNLNYGAQFFPSRVPEWELGPTDINNNINIIVTKDSFTVTYNDNMSVSLPYDPEDTPITLFFIDLFKHLMFNYPYTSPYLKKYCKAIYVSIITTDFIPDISSIIVPYDKDKHNNINKKDLLVCSYRKSSDDFNNAYEFIYRIKSFNIIHNDIAFNVQLIIANI